MLNVIIIDDENWSIKYMRDLIDWNEHGTQIINTFSNPTVAMDFLLNNNDVDICFIDVEMPEITGIEFISTLRSNLPKIKFVMVSAYDNFQYVHKALRLGVVDYLLKPVEKSELIQIVDSFSTQKLLSDSVSNNESDMKLDLREETDKIFKTKDSDRILCICTNAPKDDMLKLFMYENSISYKSSDKCSWFSLFGDANEENAFMLKLKEYKDYNFGVYHCNGSEKASLAIINATDAFDGCFFLDEGNICNYNYAFAETLAENIIFIKRTIESGKTAEINSVVKSTFNSLIKVKVQASAFIQFYNQILQILNDYSGDEPQGGMYILDIYQIKRLFKNNKEFEEFFKNAINKILYEKDDMATIKNVKETIPKIKKFIEENFQNELSLKIVAKKFMVSDKYLSSVFKKQTGINIVTYINMVRIENSQKLLKNTDITIQDIAFLSGYTDFSYFARVFKKINGVTPSDYRNQN